MRSTFVTAASAAVLLIPSAAALAQTQANWVTPVGDATPMRACPGPRCEPAGRLPAGVTVLVMREERGWYWVDVPPEYRTRGRIQHAWVRVEDVRPVVNDQPEPRSAVAKTGATSKERVVAAAKPAEPVAGPAASAEACLTCAAPKTVIGSIRLSEDGAAAGGPGPGDPGFDANVVLAQKKFGGRLLEGQKQADLTRTKVNTYIRRCYDKYVPRQDHVDRRVGKPRGAVRRTFAKWSLLASPNSPFAWSDSWVERATGNMELARQCGVLWGAIHQEAGDLQVVASDIASRAVAEKIYPRAINQLLVAHSLK